MHISRREFNRLVRAAYRQLPPGDAGRSGKT